MRWLLIKTSLYSSFFNPFNYFLGLIACRLPTGPVRRKHFSEKLNLPFYVLIDVDCSWLKWVASHQNQPIKTSLKCWTAVTGGCLGDTGDIGDGDRDITHHCSTRRDWASLDYSVCACVCNWNRALRARMLLSCSSWLHPKGRGSLETSEKHPRLDNYMATIRTAGQFNELLAVLSRVCW